MQGQKSAGETNLTLAWMPEDSGQQDLVNWFDEGTVKGYKIKYPNGVVDVFKGWVSSLGKTISSKEVMTRTAKITTMANHRWPKTVVPRRLPLRGSAWINPRRLWLSRPRRNWLFLSCQQVLQISLSA